MSINVSYQSKENKLERLVEMLQKHQVLTN